MCKVFLQIKGDSTYKTVLSPQLDYTLTQEVAHTHQSLKGKCILTH